MGFDGADSVTDEAKEKQIKNMMNRPVKDPRSEALRNIENKSISSMKNQNSVFQVSDIRSNSQ